MREKNGSHLSGTIPTRIHKVIMIVEVKQGLSSKSGNFNTGSDALQACASILVSNFNSHIGLRSSIPRIAGSYKFFYQKKNCMFPETSHNFIFCPHFMLLFYLKYGKTETEAFHKVADTITIFYLKP